MIEFYDTSEERIGPDGPREWFDDDHVPTLS